MEAFRLIYRAVSDIPELRTPKNYGYSKLGPLNAIGRSIIYNTIPIVEGLIGEKFFYGLDEVKINGITLRRLFYELSDEYADKVIEEYDNSDRRIPIRILRDSIQESINRFIEPILSRVNLLIAQSNPYKHEVVKNTSEILSKLSK